MHAAQMQLQNCLGSKFLIAFRAWHGFDQMTAFKVLLHDTHVIAAIRAQIALPLPCFRVHSISQLFAIRRFALDTSLQGKMDFCICKCLEFLATLWTLWLLH